MPLPTINSVNPTSTPAIEAIQFAEAFLTELVFRAAAPTDKWACSIVTRNWNASLGLLAPEGGDTTHRVSLTDVASYAAQYSVFAQILGGVLVVAGLVQAEQKAQSNKAIAVSALAVVNRLKDTDPTKAEKLTAANLALATANEALNAARLALGATI